MTRIAPSTAFAAVPTEDLGQGDRINLGVASIISRLPAVAEALGALTAAMSANGSLSPRLLELVRLRIAFFNQCRSCIAVRYQSAIDDGLDEGAVCSLERPADADNLSDAEQSALSSPSCLRPTISPSTMRSTTNCASTSTRTSWWNSACTARSRWVSDDSRRRGMSAMIFPNQRLSRALGAVELRIRGRDGLGAYAANNGYGASNSMHIAEDLRGAFADDDAGRHACCR